MHDNSAVMPPIFPPIYPVILHNGKIKQHDKCDMTSCFIMQRITILLTLLLKVKQCKKEKS